MQGQEDPYLILGVSRDATEEEIKSAFRAKAKELHPDLLGARGVPEEEWKRAEEELKRVNRAYATLSDPAQRRWYETLPKPVLDPASVRFKDVEPGSKQEISFVIKNLGGSYKEIEISNPDSWIRVVQLESFGEEELPLLVHLEAEGNEWATRYAENIRVLLDGVSATFFVELTTRENPAPKEVFIPPQPQYRTAQPPPPQPQVVARRSGGFGWVTGILLVVVFATAMGVDPTLLQDLRKQYVMLTAPKDLDISPPFSSSEWSLSSTELRHSSDGGRTWTKLFSLENGPTLSLPRHGQLVGRSTERVINDGANPRFMVVAISLRYADGYTAGCSFRTSDGGATWRIDDLYPIDRTSIVATNDHGRTWREDSCLEEP